MVSNLEIGRRFQERCHTALEQAIGRKLDLEVRVSVPGLGNHSFDLATPERDVFAECKAYGWTKTGNTPSAKISNLREAAQYLRGLPGQPRLYLIMKRDQHPRREETLAEYFARLNEELLGPVTLLEMPEEGGPLTCLHGTAPGNLVEPLPAAAPQADRPVRMGPPELGLMRRQLFRICDHVEGVRSRDESLPARIGRLQEAGKIPRVSASLMRTVLTVRNAVEYDDAELAATESTAVISAWAAIREWAEALGWRAQD